MTILDHPLITERYFFPRMEPPPDPFYVDCGDAQLACHHHVVDENARTIIYFHGNGEIVADYIPDLVDVFGSLRLNVFFAEYRGYGGSTGTAQLGKMLEDVEPTFRSLGLEEGKVVVFGRSVGSIFAIELVYRHPGVSALILESGIADVHERLLLRVTPQELGVTREQFEQEASEHLDHEKKLNRYQNPLLVLHSRHDGLVDVAHGERNHAWAKSENKRLLVFSRGDHNSIMAYNFQEYWGAVAEFLGCGA